MELWVCVVAVTAVVYFAVCSVAGAVGLAVGMGGIAVGVVRWPPLGRAMVLFWPPGWLALVASVDMGRKTRVVGTTILFWFWARLASVSKMSVMGRPEERAGGRGTTPRPHGGK